MSLLADSADFFEDAAVNGLICAALGWPDVIVGLGIAFMNLDAAREVWNAARAEHRLADAKA